MAVSRSRIVFGLVVPLLFIGAVVLLFGGMGVYRKQKRVADEGPYIARLAALEEQLGGIEGEALQKLRRLPVLHEERVKPFDSMARSILRHLSGQYELYEADPAMTLMSMVWDRGELDWDRTPVFLVSFGVNRELVGIPTVAKLASRDDVVENAPLAARRAELEAEFASDFAKMPPSGQELFKLRNLATAYEQGFPGLFRIVPPTPEQQAAETGDRDDWHRPEEALRAGHDPVRARALTTAWSAVERAWKRRDPAALSTALDELDAAMTAMNPAAMPDGDAIEAELAYQETRPFDRASWMFLAASLVAVFALVFRKGILRWIALGCAAVGLAYSGWGFALRTALGFGVSITNLYESMLAMAVAVMLIAVIVDLVRRSIWTVAVGGVGAFVVLELLDRYTDKFDSKIGGVIAVLANNFWVHIHVPVVMASYAAYFVAFLLALIAMPWLFRDPAARNTELKGVLRTTEIATYLGTLLIVVGMVLGGLWAHDSWGRFWGWDPKETWALVLSLWFFILIHARHLGVVKRNPFWFAWGVYGGGNVMLWTYYGTNELLSGLHSYANSSGDAGFWENFVHDRNRWFVWTTALLLVTWIGVGIAYAILRGDRRRTGTLPPAPDDDAVVTGEVRESWS